MDFVTLLKDFIVKAEKLKSLVSTEEATKMSLIVPFFQTLGYDVFNPDEFMPEYTADVGIKKGEKVDYAIILNGHPTILIEAKSVNQKLQKHDSQLFRYFGTSAAKFAILTNGIDYKFYTDLEEENKMDTTPFLQINLLEMSESDFLELKKFTKENIDLETLASTAADLKYLGLIKKVLKEQFETPSDEFLNFILTQNVYDGRKTQNIIEKYRGLIKKSITQYINELIKDKIQNAFGNHEENDNLEAQGDEEKIDDNGIITTEEEMQCYYIVKSILVGNIPLERITFKDTATYFGIQIDNMVTKWICRIYIKENTKYIIIPNEKEQTKYVLETVEDIYQLSDVLIARAKTFC